MGAGDLFVGQKDANPWGPQVLVYFSFYHLLPIGFFGYPFLTHSQLFVGFFGPFYGKCLVFFFSPS